VRVLLLPSWYPDDGDPLAGIFIRDQAEVLASVYDVAVVVPVGVTGRRSTQGVDGVLPVFREPFSGRVPGVSAALNAYRRAAERGAERARAAVGPFDIIHAHVSLPAGWAAVDLGRRLGIPVVLTEHLSPFDPATGAPKQQEKIREALTASDAVVAVSPHLREQMRRFQPDLKSAIVGNVIRDSFFTPSSEDDPGRSVRFFSAGILTEQKGFSVLVDATRILVDEGMRLEVVIAGDGPLRMELTAAAADLPVVFFGALSRERMREELRACSAFVGPSLHESFGVVLGEAMACGKPVVSTRCGGPEFVVGSEAGLLVAPGSAGELAEALASVVEGRVAFDPEAIRSSLVTRFGEEAFLAAIGAVYERARAGA